MLRRLAQALVLGIALAYAAAWFSERVLRGAFSESRETTRRGLLITRDLERLHSTVLEMETSVRGFLLASDAAFLSPYESARHALPSLMASLHESLAPHADSTAHLERIEQLVRRWQEEVARPALITPPAGPRDESAFPTLARRGKDMVDAIRVDLSALSQSEDTRLRERLAALEAQRIRAHHLVRGAFAFTALVSLIGVYLTTRRLRRDIACLVDAAAALPLGRFSAPPSAFVRELQPLSGALSGAAASLDKQRRRAAALLDVATALSKTPDPVHVLDGLHATLKEILHLGHLVLIRREGSRLVVVATRPAAAPTVAAPGPTPPIVIDPPAFKALLESQETQLLSPAEAPHLAKFLDHCAARSDHFALVPLAVEQRTKYLLLVSPDASRRYTTADVAFLDLLANQIGGAFALGELYADLQSQNAALLKANDAKSEFLASMSHELRTPLNSILGFSDVLLGQQFGSLSDRQHRYLEHINAGGRHLLAMINDLLDLSKVDSGRLEISFQNCSLQTVLQEAIATSQVTADERFIRVVLAPGPLPTVLADPVRIRQVLQSVLSDAIRSSPVRGDVSIEHALIDTERRVRLCIKHAGASSPDRRLAGWISVAAAPVPASAVTTAGTANGLGLALARRLVEAMDGRFSMVASRDDGTVYTIELPRQLPTYPELPALSAEAISPLALIVDDDAMARTMIDVQLRASGYRTLSAGTGEEALVLARSARPDLITLDVFLPGIDGWDVLRLLRGDASTGSIPVLMVSLDGDSDKAVQLGARGHLRKPIDAADLQRLVAETRAAAASKGG